MKKFCVTDPCYILPDDVWSKCCKVFDEYKDDEFVSQRFDEAVTKALTKFAGSKAYACDTGYGDWSNILSGSKHVINECFCADAGMVCVCELTDKVHDALKDHDLDGTNHCVAIFEAEDLSNIEFDVSDKNWTVVNIETTDGQCLYTKGIEYDDDDYDSYDEEDDDDWQYDEYCDDVALANGSYGNE